MVNSVGFRFSPNTGKLLENLAFLTLRQQTREIYYYVTAGGYEVDFYLPERRQLIQVSQRLTDPQTRERELRAIEETVKEMHIENALILADSNEDKIAIGGVPVKIQSITEWLVNQEL
jgi:predicted AAA+ superfamily ATPase